MDQSEIFYDGKQQEHSSSFWAAGAAMFAAGAGVAAAAASKFSSPPGDEEKQSLLGTSSTTMMMKKVATTAAQGVTKALSPLNIDLTSASSTLREFKDGRRVVVMGAIQGAHKAPKPLNAEASSSGGDSVPDEAYDFTTGVLGDLHLDPRSMEDHYKGQEDFKAILDKDKEMFAKQAESMPADLPKERTAVVSLGDLGESKDCDGSGSLFAGTSSCFKLARSYLDGFGVPFEVIGGNHDLEGIDEYPTDALNLEAYLEAFSKDTAQFSRQIAHKTLLVGLGSTVFRDAQYTSHEVYIDDEQIAWFKNTIESHPASEGWRIFVFSHAPPMGSGLRVLQENHVVNGCCWLNHSSPNTGVFIDIVRQNPCIKAWFSGHFHLGQDYQDSITFPNEGNRGSCVFVQTAVMSSKSSRDTRQQSRMLRGNKTGFTISTINHAKGEEKERLDATVTYTDNDTHESIVYAHPSEDYDHDQWFEAYTPQEEDGCYIGDSGEVTIEDGGKDGLVCWWHMACGRVLGVHKGMVIEYDTSTLAPLGLVVGKDELAGRKVAVIDSGLMAQDQSYDAAQMENREQALILYDENSVTVVQPNEDGSYWRKIVRNKMVRMKEKRREDAAKRFAKEQLQDDVKIRSSWGPYTSTSGTAKNTGLTDLLK